MELREEIAQTIAVTANPLLNWFNLSALLKAPYLNQADAVMTLFLGKMAAPGTISIANLPADPPVVQVAPQEVQITVQPAAVTIDGLPMRDALAAAILARLPQPIDHNHTDRITANAKTAYAQADAMMTVREE